MATLNIYSNDGTTLLNSSECTSFVPTAKGFTINNSSTQTTYTYTGNYILRGATNTASSSTINYVIGTEYTISATTNIYIVESPLNKVVVNGSTKLDLSGDTATADKVLEGYTFHTASGETDVGTYSGGSISQYLIKHPYVEQYNSQYTRIYNLDTSKKYLWFGASVGSPHATTWIVYEDNAWSLSFGDIHSQTETEIIMRYGSLSYFGSYTYGVICETDSYIEDDPGVDDAIITLWGDQVFAHWECILKGTPITLADGTTKPIEDITFNDDLLIWDFYNGCFSSSKPLWIKKPQIASEYNHLKFSNGSELSLIGTNAYHRIFNKQAGKFTYTGTDDTPIGTITFTDKGFETELLSQEIIHEDVEYYNVITDTHFNLFANGILTSCNASNIYAIEDMKYTGEKLLDLDEYFSKFDMSVWEKRK